LIHSFLQIHVVSVLGLIIRVNGFTLGRHIESALDTLLATIIRQFTRKQKIDLVRLGPRKNKSKKLSPGGCPMKKSAVNKPVKSINSLTEPLSHPQES